MLLNQTINHVDQVSYFLSEHGAAYVSCQLCNIIFRYKEDISEWFSKCYIKLKVLPALLFMES